MTTTQTLTRPASLAEWQERTQLVGPLMAESRERGLAYQPQSSDLFISPFGKCGTTGRDRGGDGCHLAGDRRAEDGPGCLSGLDRGAGLTNILWTYNCNVRNSREVV